ncbi:DNA replication protein [Texas Phoenix palm phytoplasma]|uniref:DNA replication protein n=1 Tax=Texas Phoenix palm phytoplasma TaxID=176709 RepID=A0ABS5BID4_9MOLU|nr:DnaD domain protein [Texas Phoenix palm phytoplasma]MBP3059340.1 DNA replication protein [Texas Phoenix palm phytoplasma]
MIKILYEKGFINIEKILIKEYSKLNLNLSELNILLFLLECYEKKTFSSLILAKKTNLSKNEIELILEKLMQKKFFSLSSKNKDNKIIETFNLDPTFEKIEKIYDKKNKIKKEKEKKNLISETIKKLENLKNKILTENELDIVKNWYSNPNYTHKEILEAIENAKIKNKESIFFIENTLNKNKIIKLKTDEKADKILHKIFKKIK